MDFGFKQSHLAVLVSYVYDDRMLLNMMMLLLREYLMLKNSMKRMLEKLKRYLDWMMELDDDDDTVDQDWDEWRLVLVNVLRLFHPDVP